MKARPLELRICEAGEATIRVARRESPPQSRPWWVTSQCEQVIRKAENAERAGRRARGKMRQFGVHNMLRYMWVLTYEGDGKRDHAEVVEDVKLMIRRMRRRFGPLVYMYGLEPHPGACSACGKKVSRWSPLCAGAYRKTGHGWHVNLFVAKRLPQAVIKDLWLAGGRGQGFEVRVRDWGKERRHGPLRERTRAGAAYGAKYAAKGVAELAVFGVKMDEGQHRYDVSRGHAPRWTRASAATPIEALGIVARFGDVVRIIECDQTVGGGTWVRFLPRPPDE